MYKKIKQKAFGGNSGKVFKGMITLTAGAGIARLIGLLAIPVITRLYSPDEFGALSLFTSASQLLAVILTFQLILAIPLPKNDKTAVNVLGVSLTSLLVMSFLVAVGILILRLIAPDIIDYQLWLLVVLGAATMALYESLSMWASRKRNYKVIAHTAITQSIAGNLLKIGLGFLSFKYYGLIFGQMIGQSSGIGRYFLEFRNDIKRLKHLINKKRMLAVFRKYKNFPLLRMPAIFLNTAAIQTPIIFSSYIYDMKTVGQLGLAITVLSLPLNLIANAAGKAYYAEISFLGKNKAQEILTITYDVMKKMFFLAIIPVIVLQLFGTELFVLVFGEQWQQAGEIATILSFFLLVNFISNPIQHAFSVMDRNDQFLKISLRRLLLVSSVFFISGYLRLDILLCIGLYCIVLIVHYILTSIAVINIVKKVAKHE